MGPYFVLEVWLKVTPLVRLSMKELGKGIKPAHLILHLLSELLGCLLQTLQPQLLAGVNITL